MKKLCFAVGLCLLCVGLGIILAILIPDILLICLEALLIVLAGALILFAK